MYTIQVENLDETIKALSQLDSRLAKGLKDEIEEIAEPTLQKAKGYGSGLGANPTGAYGASMSMKQRQYGVVLQSTDPGGGTIEFAHQGAVYLRGPLAGQRVGVPHGSEPPRALLKAILEDEREIVDQVDEAVAKICDEVVNVG